MSDPARRPEGGRASARWSRRSSLARQRPCEGDHFARKRDAACAVAHERVGDEYALAEARDGAFERRVAAIGAGIGMTLPIFVERAGGGIVVDIDGNSIIDMGAGIAVTNVGNAAPEVVAGAPTALNDAARMLNRGGRICLAAFPHEPALVDVAYLVRNNIYVFGIRGEGKSATHRAQAFMEQKRFDARLIHTHTFELKDLPEAIRYAKERIDDAIKVVVKM